MSAPHTVGSTPPAPTGDRGTAHDDAAALALAEWSLAVSITATIVVGCGALILAYFEALTRINLLLGFASLPILAAAYFIHRRPHRVVADRISASWHDAGLVLILIVAGFRYTPPADYAPAFLDAGWYTNTAALIARTGGLEARPAALQSLPPEHRHLFIRTYADLRRSTPSFPDRTDLGFFNQVFAVDLRAPGSVAPYHPPFLATWIAAARLVSGRHLATYLPAMFGLLFVLAIYATTRSIFNAKVGLLAAALIALSPAVIYYARTPFAEPLLGACMWAGAWALTRYAAASNAKPSTALLGVAGLALGAALLIKLEAFLLIVPVGLFWLVWCVQGRAKRRQVVSFAVPFGALLALSLFLAGTITLPYAVLNGYGVWHLLTAAVRSPTAWVAVPAVSAAAIGLLAVLASPASAATDSPTPVPHGSAPRSLGQRAVAGLLRPSALARDVLGLIPLAGAGALLVVAWLSARGSAPATWSSLVALVLFATPLGAALALVGLSRLVVIGFDRKMAFAVLLCTTVGGATVLVPAVSTSVSHLYTVRRLVPVVLPCLSILAAYAVQHGFVELGSHGPRAMAIRRSAATAAIALLIFAYADAARPLVEHRELAGSSAFVAQLAQHFDKTDVVLFESVDRGSHVGRFAAPLWTEYQLAALQLSTTHPSQAELAAAVRHWQAENRAIYYVTQAPPPALAEAEWDLIAREEWAGRTVAATLAFPPETWLLPITFNIYELQ